MYQEKLVYYLQPFKDIFELESTILTSRIQIRQNIRGNKTIIHGYGDGRGASIGLRALGRSFEGSLVQSGEESCV